MEKLKELYDLIIKYLNVDIVKDNTELAKNIRDAVKRRSKGFTLQDLGKKMYGEEIDFEPILEVNKEEEQLSFLDENGNLKEQEVPGNIEKILNETSQSTDVEISYENLGYTFEKVRYYINTLKGKKELGQYKDSVKKFTNVLSPMEFLVLIERLVGKRIELPLTYYYWENCGSANNPDSYCQTWREYNYNICEDLTATDGTVICPKINFTNYKGYKYNEFFPENLCITLNPLDYFNENLSFSKQICDKLDMFNEDFLKSLKPIIPNLFDEDRIINSILLAIKEEIIEKIEYYIQMLKRISHMYDEDFSKTEEGVYKFKSEITNYISFGNIGHLCNKYELPVPDFTDESLDKFVKALTEYAENEIMILSPVLEEVRKKRKQIEEENRQKEEILKSKKQEFLSDERLKEFESLIKNGELISPAHYSEDPVWFIEEYTIFDIVNGVNDLISLIKSSFEGEKKLDLSYLYKELEENEKFNNKYLQMNPEYFYGQISESPYQFITQHDLPYENLKIIIDYLKESKPLLEEINSDLYDPVSTEDLVRQESYYMRNISRSQGLIYTAKNIAEGFKEIIKQYTNDYNVLKNILIFLQTVDCPYLFGEKIIKQLQELLKPFELLSNREAYVEEAKKAKLMY